MSHVDQLTLTIRYVGKDGMPIERFLKFEPISGHSAQTLFESVTRKFADLDISLSNCRGQCFDNASNMAGKYGGLQAKIKEVYALADFVPCAGHSLALAGACAAESCLGAVNYFGFLQVLYTFFSASTHRWSVLIKAIKPKALTIKTLSTTRWCCNELVYATSVARSFYLTHH